MKLNHLHLQAGNASELATFLVDFFGFEVKLASPDRRLIALGTEGFDLVIQEANDGTPVYPKDFHFGFILDDMQQVQAVYARLQQAGVTVLGEIAQNRRGTQFFCSGPGGMRIEVGCHH